MRLITPLAEKIAARLTAQHKTVAVAESSTGGLIAAQLLAIPGASAYFLGGGVIYTRAARLALLGISEDDMKASGIRPATEPYALLIAGRIRERHDATWGIGETGASGPTGNRYGDPAGHTVIGVSGPAECAEVLRTGAADREANMHAFAQRALEVFAETIGA